MPDDRQIQYVSWPGVHAYEDAEYTAGHGITPGIAFLTLAYDPILAGVHEIGDLVFFDGTRTVSVRDCKVHEVGFSQSGSGQRWTLVIFDHRWRWRFGTISGSYNLRDPRGKLVPWSIRSPTELAELCLKAMGEKDSELDMPEGLNGADWKDRTDWFKTGANTPASSLNGTVIWDADNPAQALARLCDEYGRRILFDPVAHKVIIAKAGDGKELPEGYLSTKAAHLEAPPRPHGYGVVGATVRFQCRLRLRAVGKEWDGEFIPIDQLSYAPAKVDATGRPWDFASPGQFMDVRATERLTFDEARDLALSHVFATYRIDDVDVDPPPQNELQRLFIPACGVVKNRYRLVLESTKVEQVVPGARDDAQGGRANGLTPLLEYYDGHSRDQSARIYGSVRSLSVKNWWINADRSANSPDGKRVEVGFSIDPVRMLVHFDRPMVFRYPYRIVPPGTFPDGSIYERVNRPAPVVIETAVVVLDDETLEPTRYRRWRMFKTDGSGQLEEPEDNATDPRKYPRDEESKGLNIDWRVHEDIALGFIAQYAFQAAPAIQYTGPAQTSIDSWDQWYGGTYIPTGHEQDLSDILGSAQQRADHYLEGHLLEFQLKGGTTNSYLGIWPISLSGATMQVTFAVGPDGPRTTASRNAEHSTWFPSYPLRRRQENMAPDPWGAIQNKFERNGLGRFYGGSQGGTATKVLADALTSLVGLGKKG